MPLLKLSTSERKVLLSLMLNPQHRDREISDSIDMNLFTFNKTKNVLLSSGLIKKEIVPNYGRLGFEILAFTFGSADPFVGTAARIRLMGKLNNEISTHYLFRFIDVRQAMGVHAVEDYTNFKRGLLLKNRLMNMIGMDEGLLNHVAISLRDVRMRCFFDFTPLMKADYGSGLEVESIDAHRPGQTAACRSWSDFFDMADGNSRSLLGEQEEALLLEMVRNPTISDHGLSKLVGMTRYRVKRIREMLYSEGFLKPIHVPDIVRLGYEVMMFVHFRFNPAKEAWEHFKEWGITLPPNLILLGIDKREGIGLGISATLSESTVQMAHFNRMIKSREIIVGEPGTQLFSLKNSSGEFPFSFSKPIEHRGRWESEVDGE